MKQLTALLAAVLLTAGPTVYAEAAEPLPPEPPVSLTELTQVDMEERPALLDIQTFQSDGLRYLVKVYEASPDFDPEQLKEGAFEKNGYQYDSGTVLKAGEHYEEKTKLAYQSAAVSSATKEGAATQFSPVIDYSADGFEGQLVLDRESICIEAADSQRYSYGLSETKEFTELPRRDPYYIPKTSVKNGVTLQLSDIRWSASGNGGYRASAIYSGTGSGTKVTGYKATGTYTGEVSKKALESVTYKVVYEGMEIPPAPRDMTPWLIAGGVVLLLGLLAAVVWKVKPNAKLYAMLPYGTYKLLKRYRLQDCDPMVDLGDPLVRNYKDYMVTLDRTTGKRLAGSMLRILLGEGNYVLRSLERNGAVCGARFHVEWPSPADEGAEPENSKEESA